MVTCPAKHKRDNILTNTFAKDVAKGIGHQHLSTFEGGLSNTFE